MSDANANAMNENSDCSGCDVIRTKVWNVEIEKRIFRTLQVNKQKKDVYRMTFTRMLLSIFFATTVNYSIKAIKPKSKAKSALIYI